MGKEGVVLEDEADAAPLRRDVDPAGGIKDRAAVDGDAARVRPQQAGDRLERQALA
jgi:hypothetical protein